MLLATFGGGFGATFETNRRFASESIFPVANQMPCIGNQTHYSQCENLIYHLLGKTPYNQGSKTKPTPCKTSPTIGGGLGASDLKDAHWNAAATAAKYCQPRAAGDGLEGG